MSEVILFLVIVALCTLIGWDRHETRKERQKLIQAVMSRSAQDLKDFELTEKLQFTPEPQSDPDLINIADLTDDEFQKKIIDKEIG